VLDEYHVETCWILRHDVAPEDGAAGKYTVALPCHECDLLLLSFLPAQGLAAAGRGELRRLEGRRVPVASEDLELSREWMGALVKLQRG